MIVFPKSVGRIFNIPVYIDLLILLPFSLIAWQLGMGFLPEVTDHAHHNMAYMISGIIIAFGVYLSVFLHELGHSFAAHLFGMKTHSIHMFILGGVASIDVNGLDTSRSLFITAIAGPIVSLLLVVISFLAAAITDQSYLLFYIFMMLSTINILIILFNMLPIHPLDGGRILWSFVWKVTGNKATGLKVAAWFGIVGGCLILLDFILNIFGVGLYFQGFFAILIGILIIVASISDLRRANNGMVGGNYA